MNELQLDDFNYHLPEKLIAHYPQKQRTASRLLCVDKQQQCINHQQFTDLLDYLRPNDLIVLNNSRVIPARLYGEKSTGGKVEVLVERIIDQQHVLAHVRASKSPKPNTQLILEKALPATVLDKQNDLFTLKFDLEHSILEALYQYGHIPLPPYLEREAEQFDIERYQTVFAKDDGSVAAPTAGLHFDEQLLQKIQAKKVDIAYVTLHVGAGTFQPIRGDNIEEHIMHSERIDVSAQVCEQIQHTQQRGGRIIAVGTTVVRSLESAAQSGVLMPYQGETDIFIYPGYQFNVVDALVTNFHLPKSTLLMLVSAFAGTELIKQAYQQALQKNIVFLVMEMRCLFIERAHLLII